MCLMQPIKFFLHIDKVRSAVYDIQSKTVTIIACTLLTLRKFTSSDGLSEVTERMGLFLCTYCYSQLDYEDTNNHLSDIAATLVHSV